MTQDDIKILGELSRIVERYGADSITRLANLIRDPQSAVDIATALENAAQKKSKAEASTKARSTNRIGMRVLTHLLETDPQKYALMTDMRDRLVSGAFLRSMNEVRDFAGLHGLTIGKASSRNAAIPPLLRSISNLETSAIVSLLDSMSESQVGESSLERWRELIVKPRNPVATAVEKPADS